ncbi:DUF6044 family protein [Treponema primitia]|uniref:DUF6044 family protein n=1 Tax=Treponema primitia TaxID=88058 RepID=UPI0002554EE0|nr:DUF6044 family protein [Treponema primitia]
MDNKIKLLFVFEIFVFLIAIIIALYLSGILNDFIKKFVPFLRGFNFSRAVIFNRILWYTIFALCLNIILKGTFSYKKIGRILISIIIFLQVIYIITYHINSRTIFNDSVKTWYNEIVLKRNNSEKIRSEEKYDKYISYNEFFSPYLFNRIKEDIAYTDEKVVAYGYHTGVLVYNGFNCIDGYVAAYPLNYFIKFSLLIKPELEQNKKINDYFMKAPRRLYLYGSELSFEITRKKDSPPAELHIDMDIFKNVFDGKYILSRAEISNAGELGLNLLNIYYDDKSIYTIYLYGV